MNQENHKERRTNCVRRSSRLLDPRPPLRDLTKANSSERQNPRHRLLSDQHPVHRGFAAACFGASPVASALDPRQERDSPADRSHTTMLCSGPHSKPELSTLLRTGSFYFALTGRSMLKCSDSPHA